MTVTSKTWTLTISPKIDLKTMLLIMLRKDSRNHRAYDDVTVRCRFHMYSSSRFMMASIWTQKFDDYKWIAFGTSIWKRRSMRSPYIYLSNFTNRISSQWHDAGVYMTTAECWDTGSYPLSAYEKGKRTQNYNVKIKKNSKQSILFNKMLPYGSWGRLSWTLAIVFGWLCSIMWLWPHLV